MGPKPISLWPLTLEEVVKAMVNTPPYKRSINPTMVSRNCYICGISYKARLVDIKRNRNLTCGKSCGGVLARSQIPPERRKEIAVNANAARGSKKSTDPTRYPKLKKILADPKLKAVLMDPSIGYRPAGEILGISEMTAYKFRKLLGVTSNNYGGAAIRAAAQYLGRLGGLKGGPARAKALGKKGLSDAMHKAVNIRWAKKRSEQLTLPGIEIKSAGARSKIYRNSQKGRAYFQKLYKSPEYMARRKAYRDRPEIAAKRKAYMKAYHQRPEARARAVLHVKAYREKRKALKERYFNLSKTMRKSWERRRGGPKPVKELKPGYARLKHKVNIFSLRINKRIPQ